MNPLTTTSIIYKDLQEFSIDEREYFGITNIELLSTDLRLELTMQGPSFSPLADQELTFQIGLPEDYPFSPPLWIRFTSPIKHDRVNTSGYLLLEILDAKNWLPTISLFDLIEFIGLALA